MGLVCLVYFFFSSREGIIHLEHFAARGAVMLLTFQLSDSHDFRMFHILPYLCCWTLWEKVCHVCVQLRTEGGLGLSTGLNVV